jgi:uncharacterized membrane protein
VALADGVFAIAMTLLVFQLSVPAASAEGDLGRRLAGMWPEFSMYALSFLVLAVFWLIHHVLFDLIERYDTTLLWLNVGYLMCAALVPFATQLFTEHGAQTATAVVYGLNMVIVFGAGWAMFGYATGRACLVSTAVPDTVVAGGRRMGLAYQLYLLPSLAMALLSPVASFLLYGVFVAAIVFATILGRGEAVMLWRTPREPPAEAAGAPSRRAVGGNE